MTEGARKTAKAMHQNECEDCVFNPTKLGCRWRKKGMYCDADLHSAADLIESLSAQLEQVTRERDAMRQQLHKGGRACESCRYAEDTPDNNAVCAECRPEGEDSLWSHWEWRGVEVE